jgi:Family of unknown function (DUF6152)
MERRLLSVCLLSFGLLAVCGSTLAHHGTAVYADDWTEFKQATVTKFAWANPHALIDFDVKDASGNVVHWVAETAAPQALRLIGWSKDSINPGDVISIRLYASKNGNPAGRLNRVVLKDGTILHDTVLGGDAGGKTGYRPDDQPDKK